MAINEEIRTRLVDQRRTAYDIFNASVPPSNEEKKQFDAIDLNGVSERFYRELVTNCETWWLEAIEPINGIVFEYDGIFYENTEAVAYGIMLDNPDDFKVQSEPYSIGYNYSFAALFEATPGITLSVLNFLVPQLTYRLLEKYEELTDAYFCTAFIALHDALAEFVKTDAFSRVNRFSPFHFFIQQHDHLSRPIYIIE